MNQAFCGNFITLCSIIKDYQLKFFCCWLHWGGYWEIAIWVSIRSISLNNIWILTLTDSSSLNYWDIVPEILQRIIFKAVFDIIPFIPHFVTYFLPIPDFEKKFGGFKKYGWIYAHYRLMFVLFGKTLWISSFRRESCRSPSTSSIFVFILCN